MIRVLPEHVANKIAAGEVVERPASVVKELVENAFDAGATRVTVEAEEGGRRLLRITDDGEGMSPDELPLAFAPHATSKIRDTDDLFHVASFGFRGEALASIGSVARASITSRRPDAKLGARVTCEASELGDVLDAGSAYGTIVEVRDLFYNTPVRRKFLKSASAEVARITDVLTRLILPRPDATLRFVHNGRKVLAVEAVESFERRVLDLFGHELDGKLLAVHRSRDDMAVEGFIGLPDVARATAARQYLFLNDRTIRDRGIGHAVTRGFEGYLLPRRHPVFFLKVTIDPSLVDVNVHPTKTEVRFRDKDAVYGRVYRAVRDALEQARPMASLGRLGRTSVREGGDEIDTGMTTQPSSQQSVIWSPSSTGASGADSAEGGGVTSGVSPTSSSPSSSSTGFSSSSKSPPSRTPLPMRPSPTISGKACSDRPRVDAGAEERIRFLQIHDSYILVEDGEGFYVIDQHALHERMLFEKILAQANDATEVPSQRLLVPDVVDLAPAEREHVLAAKDELAALGLVLGSFGGSSVAIEAVPLEFAKAKPQRLIDAVLAVEEEKAATGFTDVRRAFVAGMACRAAVKFNDRLSDDAIRTLVEWERSTVDSAACPHGRPTRLRVTLQELELRFLRKA